MNTLRPLALLLLSFALALPASGASEKEALRPAVGKPLQVAQKALQAKKYKEALAAIGEAENVGGLTAYESFVTAQMRASASAGAGDASGAAAAFEKVLASKRLPPDEELQVKESVAGLYLRAQNYPKAIQWIQAYESAGGSRLETLQFLPQAYYFLGDFPKAAKEGARLVARVEKAGTAPSADALRLLAASQDKSGDSAGYAQTLEKLLRYHPTPEFWTNAIRRTATQPGFSRDLELDMYRLLRASGTLTQAKDYVAAVQLALIERLPGEAKTLIDEGYEKQLLGTGAAGEVERQSRLRKRVDEQYAEDKKSIASSDADAAKAASGEPLVKTGLAYALYGDTAKGLPMIEQGIQKGGLKAPDAARLHLGYAYYLAGEKAKAEAAFKAVQGSDGAADLARLWSILNAGR